MSPCCKALSPSNLTHSCSLRTSGLPCLKAQKQWWTCWGCPYRRLMVRSLQQQIVLELLHKTVTAMQGCASKLSDFLCICSCRLPDTHNTLTLWKQQGALALKRTRTRTREHYTHLILLHLPLLSPTLLSSPSLHPSLLLLTHTHTHMQTFPVSSPFIFGTDIPAAFICFTSFFSLLLHIGILLPLLIFNFITLHNSPSVSSSLSMLSVFSFLFLSLSVSALLLHPKQAQDFYVEMKWEFTSWGESSPCVQWSSKSQYQPVRSINFIRLLG